MSKYIAFLSKISHTIFSNEFAYTYLRVLIAGNQSGVKDFVREHLTKHGSKSVLDICCGTGDFVEALPKGTTYIGYDDNPNYITYANKKHGKKSIRFVCEDVLTLKKLDKYDATLLISTMHHFSDKDMRKLLALVKYSTKNMLIIADLLPHPPSRISRLFVLLDRGNFIRPPEDKLALLRNDYKVLKTEVIKCGWAYQYCIVATIKK